MSQKKSQSAQSIPKKSTRKLILGIVLLGVGLVLGGKYLIQNRAADQTAIIVPKLSPEATMGEAVFAANCAGCHGKKAVGTDKGPPLLDQIYKPSHHGDFSFVRAVKLGVPQHHWLFGAMPAQPHIERNEIDAIVIYIRELQKANGIR